MLAAGCLEQNAAGETKEKESIKELNELIKVKIVVNYQDADKANETIVIKLPKGSTAFEAFDKTLALEYEQYSFGVYVTAVNGVSEDAGADRFWQYYADGKYAPVGLTDYKLDKDVELEFRYEKAQLK